MATIRSSFCHYRTFFSFIFSPTTTAANASALTTCAVQPNLPSEHDQDKTLEPNNLLLPSTIKHLVKSKKFAEIETLFKSLKKNPNITEEKYVSSLIQAFGNEGMLDRAFCLFDKMEELGAPRSAYSFNSLLSSYNRCGKYDRVQKLFEVIPQKYGFLPDKISYGILAKSLCASGSVESVLMVLKEMDEKNIEITTITYAAALEALYKKGNIEDAEKLWREMIEKGRSPDVVVYKVRICQASRGKPEDVLAVFDEMKKNGLEPDTSCYNYLFLCYSKNGLVSEARRVYEDLDSPNAATFRLRIAQLCKIGDFDEAYEVLKWSLERNSVPSFRIQKQVVEGLVRNSKRKEAEELIQAIREKYQDNTKNAWNKLAVGLGLCKDKEPPAQDAFVSKSNDKELRTQETSSSYKPLSSYFLHSGYHKKRKV